MQLPSIAATQLVGYVLVMCRVGGLFVLAPIFSGKMIPTQAKVIVAGAISFALEPMVVSGVKIPTGVEVVPLIMKELLVGLAFALALGVVAAGLEAAASIMDTMIGFSFAQLVDPLTQAETAIIGQLYSLFAVIVFLLIGGDHLMIEGLDASYRLIPLGSVPSATQLGAMAAQDLTQIFLIAIEVAAPVIVALALVDMALALVSRAVPQMNVFIVGIPAKIMVGLGAIAASLPFLTGQLEGQLQNAVYQALETLRVH
jgi:flagellar biosynthetic protein FliR